MSDLLALEVSVESGRDVLRAKGEIDLATAPRLERRLDELHAAGPIILDLSDVTFIDSTGLRVILAGVTRAAEHGKRVTLVAGAGPVTRLFELTGISERLAVFDSVAAAAADE